MIHTLRYLENKYKGYVGVPYDVLKEELLTEEVEIPKEAVLTLPSGTQHPVKYICFEWIAETVDGLNQVGEY